MGRCDPEYGLPAGMSEQARKQVQVAASIERELDEAWLSEPIESEAVRRAKLNPRQPRQRFTTTLADLLRFKGETV